jgi:hypothetical protein
MILGDWASVVSDRTARVLWAGPSPPIAGWTATTALLDPGKSYRCPKSFHRSFDAVVLTGVDLGSRPEWPVILDEAVRTIRDDGLLALSFRESSLLSVFALAGQLERMLVRPSLLDGHLAEDGFRTWVVRATPRQLAHTPTGVTFGVITDGRSPKAIRAFVDSVQAQQGHQAVSEVLVCGPDSAIRDCRADSVRLVPEPSRWTERGWITHKKNLLCRAATGGTLVLAHDRYTFADDFLAKLDAWGDDFSVLIPRQVAADGTPFPDWVALGSDWSWGRSMLLEPGTYSPGVYINGGVFVIRTDVMRALPLSELLFWAEGEDVEWTRRLQSAGIVPRYAPTLVAYTTSHRPGYALSFEAVPDLGSSYPAILPSASVARATDAGLGGKDLRVNLLGRSRADAFMAGLALSAGWIEVPAGFASNDDPLPLIDVALDASAAAVESLHLWVAGLKPPEVAGVVVNGAAMPYSILPPGEHGGPYEIVVACGGMDVPYRILRIQLKQARPATLTICQVGVAPSSSESTSPAVRFPSGWSYAEAEGRWSIMPTARLHIRLGRGSGGKLRLGGVAAMPGRFVISNAGVPLVDRAVDPWAPVESELVVPRSALTGSWASLDLVVGSLRWPDGEGGDHRRLGFMLKTLTETSDQ